MAPTDPLAASAITHVRPRQQYQLSTGLWVIAECEECGRGFITVGKGVTTDPYAPQKSRAFSHTRCGGKLFRLDLHPDNHPPLTEMQHD